MTVIAQPWPQLDHPASAEEEKPTAVGLPEPPPMARYPLSISADGRRLLDADGRPFLIQGDAAWSLIANLTDEEAIAYLDDRRAKGFNTLIVSLVEHIFAIDAPRDRYGNEPFTTPGDLSTSNPVYMDRAERILEACAARGMSVLLHPAYIGAKHAVPGTSDHAEGWYYEVISTGVEGCRKYGEELARRFGRFANIIWSIGGDAIPEESRDGLEAIAAGLKGAGIPNLFTAHGRPELPITEQFPDSDWLELNITYSYEVVHRALVRDWQREPVRPFFLIESSYEGEHNATDLQIRRQAWWSVLCGGNGHCMGNNPIWLFWQGWQQALDLPASWGMARWGDFFRSIAWSELLPDIEHRLAIGGLGEARGLDRVTAAMDAGGNLAVAYLPVQRALELDLDTMSASQVRVTWFEPGSGLRVNGGTLRGDGRVTLTPPFPEDAALLLEATD